MSYLGNILPEVGSFFMAMRHTQCSTWEAVLFYKAVTALTASIFTWFWCGRAFYIFPSGNKLNSVSLQQKMCHRTVRPNSCFLERERKQRLFVTLHKKELLRKIHKLHRPCFGTFVTKYTDVVSRITTLLQKKVCVFNFWIFLFINLQKSTFRQNFLHKKGRSEVSCLKHSNACLGKC